jgi:hypothetical protein
MVMVTAMATTMTCDGLEWRLDDGGTLVVRVIGEERWFPADTSHSLALAIKLALTNVAMVKGLIEKASTDRNRRR